MLTLLYPPLNTAEVPTTPQTPLTCTLKVSAFLFLLGFYVISLCTCVLQVILQQKKNEQLIGSRTQKSCFLYGLRLWGDWCEIYRLVKKKRQKSLCCILWLFYTCLKILYETISFYTVACIPFWVQVWGLVTETAAKKPGICPRLGTNPYSSSLPQHLLWPHWSHIKEWGYLFTYLIGHCKECESWQRLGLESTMPLAK